MRAQKSGPCAVLIKRMIVGHLMLLISSTVSASEDFSISLQTDTSASASIDGGLTQTAQNPTSSHASVVGSESSQCQPYGRGSSASSAADVQQEPVPSNDIRYTLAVTGLSKGGHYRTCTGCVFNECAGLHGNDTNAASFAHAGATAVIAFAQGILPGPYLLTLGQISHNLPTGATVAVEGPEGPIAIPTGAQQIILHASPGAIFTVRSSLDLSTKDKGGCCEDHKAQSLPMQIAVHPAPLAATNDRPLMLGGTFASGFHSVAIVELKKDDGTWATHCTATLIGDRTALTAAHCVAGRYKPDVDKKNMRLLFGSSMDDPNSKIYSIKAAKYPEGKVAGEFNYRVVVNGQSITTEDDIAVVLLNDSPPKDLFPRYALYSGVPSLESLTQGNDKEPLYFVGYGLYDITTSQDGKLDTSSAGKRRQAIVPIDAVQNQTFSYVANKLGQNVCAGDSGGPAMLERAPTGWMIVGVTAYGAETCVDGRSMRVDVYKKWIDSQFAQ
ncbi:trypsin-like serine protease [Paraburkholderia sp. RL17-381-BIF-C]|uniref:trypsin-like serine protease n=1 Tax=Paraburkholderia sp. RL17-381-BIF-C TaxID=3031635 RepID=UPI0038B7436D